MNGRVAVGAPVDLLLLEGPHEALCLGVVVRVADPAHARPDAVRRQPGDVVFTGILGGFKRSSQTRSLLAYRATPKTDPASPHCDTRRVHFDRRVIWRRCFRRCWWPNLDKHSAVLRDALPEAGRLRGMVRLVSPRNAIWILNPERRHPSHGDIPTRSVPDVA